MMRPDTMTLTVSVATRLAVSAVPKFMLNAILDMSRVLRSRTNQTNISMDTIGRIRLKFFPATRFRTSLPP